MSELSSRLLREIANALEVLAEQSIIRISALDVDGYTVHVRRIDDQREGTRYVVTRIGPLGDTTTFRGSDIYEDKKLT